MFTKLIAIIMNISCQRIFIDPSNCYTSLILGCVNHTQTGGILHTNLTPFALCLDCTCSIGIIQIPCVTTEIYVLPVYSCHF